MYTPFEELSDESRIWIYQGSRPFTTAEVELVSKALMAFCEEWAAHGQPLKSSFRIENNQFVIMAVDEDFHNPSGCSIDSSVGVLRQIHSATGVDLLDRTQVSFYKDEKVELMPLAALKASFASGALQASTITFNTLATTKAEWKRKWMVAAENSWMVKYLSKSALTS
jgi:hypothetical protein